MFQGSMVALATPMTPSGDVDESALESLVTFHLENGTDAIVAMGTTGESATFSHKEHREVVKTSDCTGRWKNPSYCRYRIEQYCRSLSIDSGCERWMALMLYYW